MNATTHRSPSFTLARSALYGAIYILLSCASAPGQEMESGSRWFPSGAGFTPFFANHEEPRVGIAQEIGNSRMKVAIGNAIDAYEHRWGGDTMRVSALFFAYALANDHRGYRLKIDAADGFFGLGVSLHGSSPWSYRFRFLHLSAHMVDGHYYDELKIWRDGKEPFPFSRNYAEVIVAYHHHLGPWLLRPYAGITYAPIVKPVAIRKWTILGGWELHGSGSTHVYGAHHFTVMGTPTVIGSNAVEAGVKFGPWNGKGARLFLSYQNGWDNFGEYYNVRREAVAAGFAFDWD